MSSCTNYLEVQWRKHMLRTGSYTKPTNLYVCLCTADPTEAATGSSITEPGAGGYSRSPGQLDPGDSNWTGTSSTDGVSTNATALTWTASGGNYGTISHLAIVDASSSGNALFQGALTASKTINDGDSFTFPIGSISITFA